MYYYITAILDDRTWYLLRAAQFLAVIHNFKIIFTFLIFFLDYTDHCFIYGLWPEPIGIVHIGNGFH